ncbi:MAG TPA: PAS domain S-box protein, partial [Acidimicrobiales bacterium]|nr:PAS domain S-box protein [Acidimicrobiales bacterium]
METAQHSRLPAMFRAAAAVAPVAMLVADSRGKLLAANQRWIDLAGPAEVTVRPETWTGVFEPESRIRMAQYMEDVASGIVTPESVDLEMITRAGRRWTRWWVRREEVEEYVLLTIVAVDVHDDVAQKQDLRELATHDHLTG